MSSNIQMHSLQQGLGLACRVIWTEVLVLLHLLLQREELTLQLTAQTRESVPDVVGQLLETDRGSTVVLQNQWHCQGGDYISQLTADLVEQLL